MPTHTELILAYVTARCALRSALARLDEPAALAATSAMVRATTAAPLSLAAARDHMDRNPHNTDPVAIMAALGYSAPQDAAKAPD